MVARARYRQLPQLTGGRDHSRSGRDRRPLDPTRPRVPMISRKVKPFGLELSVEQVANYFDGWQLALGCHGIIIKRRDITFRHPLAPSPQLHFGQLDAFAILGIAHGINLETKE